MRTCNPHERKQSALSGPEQTVVDCAKPPAVAWALAVHPALATASGGSYSDGSAFKSCCLHLLLLLAQVPGCGFDLSESPYYYKRHRVCEGHMKARTVLLDGTTCRLVHHSGMLAGMADGWLSL